MRDPNQQPAGEEENTNTSPNETTRPSDTSDLGLDRNMDQIDINAANEIGSDPPGSLGLGFDPDVDDAQSSKS